MTDVLLIRHAQSEWNVLGRWQGWADPPLSARGAADASALSSQLRSLRLGGAVASDLQRASSTARLLCEPLGIGSGLRLECRLRERDVGDWSGLTRTEIEKRWPGQLLEWSEGRLNATPGGESDADVLDRLVPALSELGRRASGPEPAAAPEPVGYRPNTQTGQDAAVLAVSHGGVIAVLEQYLGIERRRIDNLAGRWLRIEAGRICAGEPFEGAGR